MNWGLEGAMGSLVRIVGPLMLLIRILCFLRPCSAMSPRVFQEDSPATIGAAHRFAVHRATPTSPERIAPLIELIVARAAIS